MHEIITLQLGQQSNYLATHFWNAQESYFTYSEDEEKLVNHDIHWRQGIGADGTETFMPRTVIYDLKGGFGALRKINALYETQEEGPPQGLWNGQAVVQRQDPIEPSAYTRSLDAGLPLPELTTSTVRYWSDFNRVFFHPRSAVQLSEYELNSSLMPFERWATGEDLFCSLDRDHDLADRDLRPFVEEADQMQAIQVFAGFDDAWGGFASRYLERLRDEYGKTTLWVWGLQDPLRGVPREKRLLKLANKARALTEVCKKASVVVPLTIPQTLSRSVSLDTSSPWHTSALIASAIESATLPARAIDTRNRDTLGGMGDLLNAMGKQSVASLQMTVSAPSKDSADRRDRRAPGHRVEDPDEPAEGVHLDLDLSPSDQLESSRRQNGFHKPRVFSQVVVRRGFEDDEDKPDAATEEEERNRRRSPHEPVTRRYHSSLKFPLLDSFPRIFQGDDGETLTGAVDVTASLTTDSSVSDKFKALRATVTRSIGLEDREQLSNDLGEMADEYHEGWSSGSDEGDDD